MIALAVVPASLTVWLLVGIGSWVGISLGLGLAWTAIVYLAEWKGRRRAARRGGHVEELGFPRGAP